MNKYFLTILIGTLVIPPQSPAQPGESSGRKGSRMGSRMSKMNGSRPSGSIGNLDGDVGVRRPIPNFKISSSVMQVSFHGETRLVLYDQEKNLELLVTKNSSPQCLDSAQKSGVILQAGAEHRTIDLGGVVYRPYHGSYFEKYGRRHIEVDVHHCVIRATR